MQTEVMSCARVVRGDMLIAGGTSLQDYPAARVNEHSGAHDMLYV